MNLAFLTSWNAVCGVAEFMRNLVSEFEKSSHQITIFSNFFAGEYEQVSQQFSVCIGEEYPTFVTGFDIKENHWNFNLTGVCEGLGKNNCRVLMINYQDFLLPNKQAINSLLVFCKEHNIKTFILFHDSCISPDIDLSLADHLVFPPSVIPCTTLSKAICIDQGIPEFNQNLFCDIDALRPFDPWKIGCFGMGRNRIKELFSVIEEINGKALLDAPLKLVLSGKSARDYQESEWLDLYPDYCDAATLALRLHQCHACIIWYPDIQQKSTSSAFRFAIGSKIPIIANRSNWVRDQLGNGAWIEVAQDDPELFKKAIIKTFQAETYPLTRERITILQQKLIDHKGWSKIAKQYETYF